MKIDNDIKIEVKASLTVGRETAETCMRLLELYCRDNDLAVRTFIPYKKDDEVAQAELGLVSVQSFLEEMEEIRSLYDEHYERQKKEREAEE